MVLKLLLALFSLSSIFKNLQVIYYVAFITSIKAELFIIKCSISQVYSKENIFKIIVVINFIYIAKKIFNNKIYSYQIYITAIFSKL